MRCLARLASVVAAIVLFAPAFAHAANFPVTKQADTNDGICDADCSLREAVVAANASPGPDDISVPVGHYTLTIPGSAEQAAATGDLDLATDNVTITGAGAASTVIDAGGDTGIADRVFDVVTPTITATISNVTITGGRSPSDGGGVNSDGSAILDHDVISGNKTAGGGEGGGVVANGGTPTLVTIRDSVVTGNQASNGGGYSNNGGSFSASAVAGGLIERSTFSGNTATDTGGGVGGGVIEDGGGDLRIRDTTISGNRAEGTGPSFGGGFSANGGGPGSVAISNTTISGNTASGPDSFGGGYAEDGGGIVGLTNVTIADNSIEGTGTTPQHSGGDVVEAGNGTTTFKNSIVSAGTPTNCVVTIGTIVSAGNNLDSGTSCGFTGSGDQSGADPLLGPLADNGGPTQTRRLGNGSPAIDTGDNAACPAADQRGVARPQPAGGTCDKGAFERLPADVGVTMSAPPTRTRGQTITYALVVTNHGPSTAPSVTLTDALPAGLAGAAASSSAGSCAVAAQVSCNLGDLAGGATATVTIPATAAQAGTVTNTAAVGHGVLVDDPNGTNDSATAQTVVQNKPALVPLRGKTVLVRVVKGTVLVAVPVRRGRVAG